MKKIGLRRASIALCTALVIGAAACSSSSRASKTSKPKSAAPPAERIVTMNGVTGSGPAQYDHVRVLEVGPRDAKNVLVLEPGTSAGAEYFRLDAEDIVAKSPGWQVWSIDRRENLLEDHSVLDEYIAGSKTPQQVFDYYLGWLTNPKISPHFQAPTNDAVAFARQWGMDVTIGDLHRVIANAKQLGGKVVLGGHSLGGTITAVYATWDFNGKAGADDLDGLVLIDGGSGSGSPISVTDAHAQLQKLATSSPFIDLVGLGLPWSAGVFNALGSNSALRNPNAASLAYTWSAFPAMLKPPVLPTNAAQYGYAARHEDRTAEPQAGADAHRRARRERHAPRVAQRRHHAGRTRRRCVRGRHGDGRLVVVPPGEAVAGRRCRQRWRCQSRRRGARCARDARRRCARADLRLRDRAREPACARRREPARQAVGRPAQGRHPRGPDQHLRDCDPIAASPDQNDFLKTVEPFLHRIA